MVRAWRISPDVAVIPINGDGSVEAEETIRGGQSGRFVLGDAAGDGQSLLDSWSSQVAGAIGFGLRQTAGH
jgi:hypothetical protein